MRRTLIAIAVLVMVALFTAPVAATFGEVALIVVDVEEGDVDVSSADPTGNAPPPLVIVQAPDDTIIPPAQNDFCGVPPFCD